MIINYRILLRARAHAHMPASECAHALLRAHTYSTGVNLDLRVRLYPEYKHDFSLVPLKIGTNESSAPGLQNAAPGYIQDACHTKFKHLVKLWFFKHRRETVIV